MSVFDMECWNELGDMRNCRAYVGIGCADMYVPCVHLIINEKVPEDVTVKKVAVITLDPFNPRVEKVFSCSTVMPQRKYDSDVITEWIVNHTDFRFPSFLLRGKDGAEYGYYMLRDMLTGISDGYAYMLVSEEFPHSQHMRSKPIEYYRGIDEEDLRPLDSDEEEIERYLDANLKKDITMEGLKALCIAWKAACSFHYGKCAMDEKQMQTILNCLFSISKAD